MFFFDDLRSKQKGFCDGFFTIVTQLHHFLFADLALALEGFYFIAEICDVVLFFNFFSLKGCYFCLHDLVFDFQIHQQFLYAFKGLFTLRASQAVPLR